MLLPVGLPTVLPDLKLTAADRSLNLRAPATWMPSHAKLAKASTHAAGDRPPRGAWVDQRLSTLDAVTGPDLKRAVGDEADHPLPSPRQPGDGGLGASAGLPRRPHAQVRRRMADA